MTSIKNDTLAVGTVASGAAVYSVVAQNKSALKRVFVNPVVNSAKKIKNAALKKDTYVKAKNAAGKAFKGETYKKMGSKVAEGVKNLGKKETYGNAFKATKEKVAGATKGTWSFIKKAFNSVKNNTNWAKVGKTAGIAAGIAAACLIVKAVYDKVNE